LKIAQGLRNAVVSPAALARQVVAAHPNDYESLARSFAFALEMLGVSNRQIRLYARKNFEMAASLVGEIEWPNLLKKALLVRWAIEPFLNEVEPISRQLGDAFHIQGGLDAVEQAGVDAGLAAEDARANAPRLIEQLEVFNGPKPQGLRHSSPSAEDLALGMRTLASQESIASPLEPQRLIEQLTHRMHRLECEPGPSQPGLNRATRMPRPEGGLKRRRGSSSVFAQEADERSQARQRSMESYGVGGAGGIASQPSSSNSESVAISEDGSDELAAFQQKLLGFHHSGGPTFADEQIKPWLDHAQSLRRSRESGENAGLRDELLNQAAQGWLERLPLVRDEALGRVERFIETSGGNPRALMFAGLAQAEVFPMVGSLGVAALLREGGEISAGVDGRTLIAYPVSQDLSGVTIDSAKSALFTMTRLLLSSHLHRMMSALPPQHGVVRFASLAKNLLDVVRKAKVPPWPRIDELEVFSQQGAIDRAWTMVVDSIAAAISQRVLGLPLEAETFAHRQTWRCIITQAMARMPDSRAVHAGLVLGQSSHFGAVFQAIDRAAARWLERARPAVRLPAFKTVTDELVKAANAGRHCPQAFTEDDVLARLEDNLWLFMASPYMGATTKDGMFVPVEDHSVGYIQHAVLEQRLPTGYTEEAARRIVDSTMLALQSRGRDGTFNLLLDIAMKAFNDPRGFAEEFMGDMSGPRRR
jgi:hypothetical protein